MRFCPATALAATENGCTTRLAGLVTVLSTMSVGPIDRLEDGNGPAIHAGERRLLPAGLAGIGHDREAVAGRRGEAAGGRRVDRAGQRGAAGDRELAVLVARRSCRRCRP